MAERFAVFRGVCRYGDLSAFFKKPAADAAVYGYQVSVDFCYFKVLNLVIRAIEVFIAKQTVLMRFRPDVVYGRGDFFDPRAEVMRVGVLCDYQRIVSRRLFVFVEIFVTFRAAIVRRKARRRTSRGNSRYWFSVVMGVFGRGVFQLCICLYARNAAAVGYIVVAVGSLTERRLFRVRLKRLRTRYRPD